MSVPEAVFVAAGYSAAEAKKIKKAFDSQDIQLQHLTNGDVTQVPLHRAAPPSTGRLWCPYFPGPAGETALEPS